MQPPGEFGSTQSVLGIVELVLTACIVEEGDSKSTDRSAAGSSPELERQMGDGSPVMLAVIG